MNILSSHFNVKLRIREGSFDSFYESLRPHMIVEKNHWANDYYCIYSSEYPTFFLVVNPAEIYSSHSYVNRMKELYGKFKKIETHRDTFPPTHIDLIKERMNMNEDEIKAFVEFGYLANLLHSGQDLYMYDTHWREIQKASEIVKRK